MQNELYVDGGVIGRNPSLIGGTWSWVLVHHDAMLSHASGVITPAEIGLPKITNNLTELLAALKGIAAMPPWWGGVIRTDSQVTFFRLRNAKAKMKGIPDKYVQWLQELRAEKGPFQVELLKGHPTAVNLREGHCEGIPVSRWNVMCDKLCQQASR